MKICSAPNCTAEIPRRSMCDLHRKRLSRYGTTELPVKDLPPVTPSLTPDGYLIVPSRNHILSGRSKMLAVHRIIAFEKYGYGPHVCNWCSKSIHWRTKPIDAVAVDHLNGDRLDNNPDNLVLSCFYCNSQRGKAGNPADYKRLVTSGF